MANTPPRPPIQNRSDEELLEDLCLEMRHVAVSDRDLPTGESVVPHIGEVCSIHTELNSRGVDIRPRLERLSEETHWLIPPLLADCLAYPQRLPYVREPDGIRRSLRCHSCTNAERPVDAKVFWFCDACMRRVLDAVRERIPVPGIVLFRTYNAECRCPHADADTVLASEGYGDEVYGVCERCIHEEIHRRAARLCAVTTATGRRDCSRFTSSPSPPILSRWASGVHVPEYDIDGIVDLLEKHTQRATYGAVAGLVGRVPRSVMQGRAKCPRDSWVVSAETHLPSGYQSTQIHPQLKRNPAVLETPEQLAEWIRERS